MPVFCRHNRFEANCPICSREAKAAAPPPSRSRGGGGTSPAKPRPTPAPRSGSGLRTRKLARAADDGFRSELVPGLRATADAERLALALALAAERLEPPGPHEAVATEPDLEEATWLAFLLALEGDAGAAGPRPSWASGSLDGVAAAHRPTAEHYRAWVERAGSQERAFGGEPAWTPGRRFSRIFERLALPGFGRAPRFDLLATLGAAGVYPLEAERLHLGGDDATTLAAKRALVSGDVLLLERRAAALAGAARIPLAALDRGLATWGAPGAPPGAEEPPRALAGVRAALGLA